MFCHRTSAHLLASVLLISSVSATPSGSKWSSTVNTTLADSLPECARQCVAGVDTALSCWSYGCVCSESSPGTNFVDGTRHIQQCVRQACPDLGEGVVSNALNFFQTACGISYFVGPGNGSEPVTATGTATQLPGPTPTQSSSVPPPINPIMIYKPSRSYENIKPCVRWVLNNCESPKDSSSNCKPDKPLDHSQDYTGLGRYLQCSTTECVCGATKFSNSLQKFYERADYYCNIGFPYQGADPQHNDGFQTTVKMLTEFCSNEGFVIEKWVVTVYGFKEEDGMTREQIISIAFGTLSGVLAIVSIVLAWLTLRTTNQNQKEQENNKT
ncbi:hypothetical protein QBC44DRAFT_397896 [Cladorrhinum sp. PSN332]|nr:hypothetical protein QBC44DRAFT_397896 [Cladorrhinum sp. PSN332]